MRKTKSKASELEIVGEQGTAITRVCFRECSSVTASNSNLRAHEFVGAHIFSSGVSEAELEFRQGSLRDASRRHVGHRPL